MTPERKARIAILAMKSMIERIKLETAIIKGDAVGIATHAKNLAQLQSQAHFVARDDVPKSDHQRTVRIDVASRPSVSVAAIIEAVDEHNLRVTRI